MALNKRVLGEFIDQSDVRNLENDFNQENVRGIATSKAFIPTKANLQGVSLSSYKMVPPCMFAYVPDTSRRGDKISLAFNDSDDTYLVSSISIVFGIKPEMVNYLLPEYLYIYFNRPEFDRYARFNSWGSARETFSWEDMCAIEIGLPDINVQRKYVKIYLGLQENLDALNRGIEQMQAACDSYMERLLKTVPKKAIGSFISETDERNSDGQYDLGNLRGISIEKKFIGTKANMQGVSLKPYKIIRPDSFCYVTVTSRNGDKVSIALNESKDTYIVSSSYVSFKIVKQGLLPQYLFMFLKSSDFDRFARFNSWGSARETFAMEDLGRFEIPVPPEEIQQDIINIFLVMSERKLLRDRLIELQKKICPILIKGAVEEGGRA